ncbi:hypothetical protein QBC32DRAFT_135640 [Pseudoneurospora amorphoporcata]|uniref:Uncharacterized protein n=1 Tax=Pseudoneurospora amorphoporcata TaxID=241081 RepID=A0AAN6NV73_9PEZI|nr:hypothetical protein QBC32DRAFT_135640 [Pseudoneurospora amorphoporcata]
MPGNKLQVAPAFSTFAINARVRHAILWSCVSRIGVVAAQTAIPSTVRGIYIHPDGHTSSVLCPHAETFSLSGTIGACCPTWTTCNYATTCIMVTRWLRYGGTNTCPSEFPSCVTRTVYDKFPTATKSWLDFECGTDDFSAHSVYREISPWTIPPSTGTPTSATSTQALPTQTVTVLPSPSSQAWIAGAVVGPVVALLALSALAFFWLRGRKGTRQEQAGMVIAGDMKGTGGGTMGTCSNCGYDYAHTTTCTTTDHLRPEMAHAPHVQSWQTVVEAPTPISMPELEAYQKPVEVA